MRAFLKNWLPPALLTCLQRGLNFIRPAQWEYVPEGWKTPLKTRGWNLAEIAQTQQTKWGSYQKIIQSSRSLGVNHEDTTITEKNVIAHNLMMTFTYVLSLSSRNPNPTMLDWGGGIGHYGLLAQEIIPDVRYSCFDLPELCKVGRTVLPNATFFEDSAEALAHQYDLVYAGSSIWYDENWKQTIDQLTAASKQYLCVNKMIFVEQTPSFVAIQRPHGIYNTEYLCWILNKAEFISYVEAKGFKLVRELLIDKSPFIFRAPEQGNIIGFLFRKNHE